MHAGNVLAHPLRRLCRAQRADAGQDINLAEQPERFHLFDEGGEQRQVVAVLGLDELRARVDFLRQALRAPGVRQSGGIFSGAEKYARRESDLAPALKTMFIAQVARDLEQRHAVQIEHRLRLRMIAGLHAVAGETQHVANAHRGAAQDIALNRNAILIPAGDLHHGRIADVSQQRADGETRHVAVRAAAVGGVDRVHVAVEDPRALVHIRRVGRIRRGELGGDRETTCAQHAFEAARRGMPGQDRQRIAGDRFVLESHGAPLLSRTTLSHEERPCRRWSTASWTLRIASTPPGMR